MTTLDADGPLPDDVESAHRLIRELLATLRQQAHLNESLQHQLERLLRRPYGKKAEKLDPDRLLLFAREILEAGGPEVAPEPTPAVPAATRPPAKGHGRKPLPAGLPRKRVVHGVPLGERPCPDCGEIRQPFGEEVREQLEYVPASLTVLQQVLPTYACEACQAHVAIAGRLPESIEKGLPGPGLMVHVAVIKYADHLPLYRQEGIFKRFGVALSRSTMCDWMAAAAGLLAPVVNRNGHPRAGPRGAVRQGVRWGRPGGNFGQGESAHARRVVRPGLDATAQVSGREATFPPFLRYPAILASSADVAESHVMQPGNVSLLFGLGPADDQRGRRVGLVHDDDPERHRAFP